MTSLSPYRPSRWYTPVAFVGACAVMALIALLVWWSNDLPLLWPFASEPGHTPPSVIASRSQRTLPPPTSPTELATIIRQSEASGGIYRCGDSGHVVFTDRPCGEKNRVSVQATEGYVTRRFSPAVLTPAQVPPPIPAPAIVNDVIADAAPLALAQSPCEALRREREALEQAGHRPHSVSWSNWLRQEHFENAKALSANHC